MIGHPRFVGRLGFNSLSRYQVTICARYASGQSIGAHNPTSLSSQVRILSLASNWPASQEKIATLTAQVFIEPGDIVVMSTYSGGIHLSTGKVRQIGVTFLLTTRVGNFGD